MKSDCIQLSTQRTIETDHRELARRDIEQRHIHRFAIAPKAIAQHTRQLLVRREIDPSASPLSSDELTQIDAWWRAANYLSVGQIYLLANPLLREPLKIEHSNTSLGNALLHVANPLLATLWMSDRSWAQTNQSTVAKWRAALVQAARFIAEKPTEARAILAKYTKLPAPVVDQLALPHFRDQTAKKRSRCVDQGPRRIRPSPRADRLRRIARRGAVVDGLMKHEAWTDAVTVEWPTGRMIGRRPVALLA